MVNLLFKDIFRSLLYPEEKDSTTLIEIFSHVYSNYPHIKALYSLL